MPFPYSGTHLDSDDENALDVSSPHASYQMPPQSEKFQDIEGQSLPTVPDSATTSGQFATEYQVASHVKYLYLTLYFGLNLSLTLFNKAVLGKVRLQTTPVSEKFNANPICKQFAFPWLLTTIHTSTASLGCFLLLGRGHFRLTKLTTQENLILLAFSVLYTVNIAISNVSL